MGGATFTIAAGILAVGALAGALAGYEADVDRHAITITGP